MALTTVSLDSPAARLRLAVDAIRTLQRDAEIEHDAACKAARRANEPEPEADLPRAGDPRWVREAARILRNHEVETWLTDTDVRAATEDLVDSVLDRLRGWEEFATIEGEVIQIRWTSAARIDRDGPLKRVLLGRGAVVPVAERMTWEGDGEPPAFRLDLSLPCALLAETDELERHLHHLLCGFGMSEAGPVKRKPDIIAHASTLGRFGIEGPREASAVAHALANPATTRAMAEFHFDPHSKQGILWGSAQPASAVGAH